jgi:hypothetical protein
MWLLYPFVIPLYSTQLHPEAAYHPGCLLVVQGLGFVYVLIYTISLGTKKNTSNVQRPRRTDPWGFVAGKVSVLESLAMMIR